jgi:hypothetical protein
MSIFLRASPKIPQKLTHTKVEFRKFLNFLGGKKSHVLEHFPINHVL